MSFSQDNISGVVISKNLRGFPLHLLVLKIISFFSLEPRFGESIPLFYLRTVFINALFKPRRSIIACSIVVLSVEI